MSEATLTIGRLARAAAVNIETVRYYQTRKLLSVPSRGINAKLNGLTRMRKALSALIEACHHTASAYPCPIIQALAPRQRTNSR
jgi:hypothetical protein